MIVPLKFRALLGEAFVLTRGLDGCIFVFPEEKFRTFIEVLQGQVDFAPDAEPSTLSPTPRPAQAEHVEARRTFHAAARQLQRFFVADATDVQADNQGRVQLPASLREHAGIDREVVVAGASNRVEIWARERWDTLNAALSDDAVMAAAEAIGIV